QENGILGSSRGYRSRGRKLFVRPVVLVPGVAANPFPWFTFSGSLAHDFDDLLLGVSAAQVQSFQALAEAQHVAMRVDQAGNNRAAAGINPPWGRPPIRAYTI